MLEVALDHRADLAVLLLVAVVNLNVYSFKSVLFDMMNSPSNNAADYPESSDNDIDYDPETFEVKDPRYKSIPNASRGAELYRSPKKGSLLESLGYYSQNFAISSQPGLKPHNVGYTLGASTFQPNPV